MPRGIRNEEKWSEGGKNTMETENAMPKRRRGTKALVLLVIIVLVVWGLYYFKVIGSGGFQAVFLNNGQVYFGKLSMEGSQMPILKDIYYLQVTQPIQPGEAGNASNINLVKLGGELHGPADEMRINRNNILFVEDLRSDSKVVQAIQQLEKK